MEFIENVSIENLGDILACTYPFKVKQNLTQLNVFKNLILLNVEINKKQHINNNESFTMYANKAFKNKGNYIDCNNRILLDSFISIYLTNMEKENWGKPFRFNMNDFLKNYLNKSGNYSKKVLNEVYYERIMFLRSIDIKFEKFSVNENNFKTLENYQTDGFFDIEIVHPDIVIRPRPFLKKLIKMDGMKFNNNFNRKIYINSYGKNLVFYLIQAYTEALIEIKKAKEIKFKYKTFLENCFNKKFLASIQEKISKNTRAKSTIMKREIFNPIKIGLDNLTNIGRITSHSVKGDVSKFDELIVISVNDKNKNQMQIEDIECKKDEEIANLVNEFESLYGGILNYQRTKELVEIKGLECVKKCMKEIKDYVNLISPEKFYNFTKYYGTEKAYTRKSISFNNSKPIQATNYEQREYDDDFFNSLYDNVKFIKKEES